MIFCVFAKASKSLGNNISYKRSSFWKNQSLKNFSIRKKMREKEEGKDQKLAKDMKERRHYIDKILKGIFACLIKEKDPMLKANILLFMINFVEINSKCK